MLSSAPTSQDTSMRLSAESQMPPQFQTKDHKAINQYGVKIIPGAGPRMVKECRSWLQGGNAYTGFESNDCKNCSRAWPVDDSDTDVYPTQSNSGIGFCVPILADSI